MPSEAIVEADEQSVLLQPRSPSPQDDERNREYLIRRTGLGDNPTQAEMDALVPYLSLIHI